MSAGGFITVKEAATLASTTPSALYEARVRLARKYKSGGASRLDAQEQLFLDCWYKPRGRYRIHAEKYLKYLESTKVKPGWVQYG